MMFSLWDCANSISVHKFGENQAAHSTEIPILVNFSQISSLDILAIMSGAPNSNQLLSWSQLYIHASSVILYYFQEISYIRVIIRDMHTRNSQADSLRPPVTLNMESKIPKPK